MLEAPGLPQYVAFHGPRRIASGTARDVVPALKQRFDRDHNDPVLVFEVDSGRQIELDLRGTLEEALARIEPATAGRGPGRPKLGVTSKEVSLLPRHWSWLEEQPGGASATLRRLVEHERRQPGPERARALRAAASRFLTAMAGDRPHYEDACRALFAGDAAALERLCASWPRDLREHALALARRADAAEQKEPAAYREQSALVEDLHRAVWSEGEFTAIARLITPRYTIHSDPGDPWDGQTLDHATYQTRVLVSRTAFPDLRFTIHDLVPAAQRVAVRWSAAGTHLGPLPTLPPSGKSITFTGHTIYELRDGKLAGHWQTVDRLGFYQQLR